MTATNTSTKKRFRAVHPFVPWLFVGPAVLLSIATIVAPFIYAVIMSLRGVKVAGGGLGRREEVFVGFANYINAAFNAELWTGFGRMLIVGVITIPITLGLALLFALLLDTPRVRLARFSRIAIFLPYAVPGVIASLMWGFIYLPGVSPIRELAASLGLAQPDFFTRDSIFWSIANINIWGGVGFNMVILYTALRGISSELYDAARVDGCTELQIAWNIKLPLLLPAIVLTALFSLIGTIQLFSEPTTLSPLTDALSSTWVPMMLVYRDTFVAQNLYGGAATSMLVAVLTIAASVLLFWITRRRSAGGLA
ncbi:ABC transporter permease [Devosia yakushimensis]|uniref:ABC transporter permease n=1 Tax=Devosia yakushimensis TaxID=470028 RepID=A0ABQ5UEQ4_9HYPH|nr:sugar ABC transporter permease [Devosia yakushimensis]GLQ10396.1 ABC transporter permease [Devosia yakushimensis]